MLFRCLEQGNGICNSSEYQQVADFIQGREKKKLKRLCAPQIMNPLDGAVSDTSLSKDHNAQDPGSQGIIRAIFCMAYIFYGFLLFCTCYEARNESTSPKKAQNNMKDRKRYFYCVHKILLYYTESVKHTSPITIDFWPVKLLLYVA